jgi:hypothetical protein
MASALSGDAHGARLAHPDASATAARDDANGCEHRSASDMRMVVMPIVVAVRVFVLRHFVCMLVTMRLRQVEYHSCEHQYAA